MKIILSMILIVFLSSAIALDCMYYDLPKFFNEADHALIGEVVSKHILRRNSEDVVTYEYKVRRRRQLKGSSPRTFVFTEPYQEGGFLVQYEEGKNYIFMTETKTRGRGHNWMTHMCAPAPLSTVKSLKLIGVNPKTISADLYDNEGSGKVAVKLEEKSIVVAVPAVERKPLITKRKVISAYPDSGQVYKPRSRAKRQKSKFYK